MITEQQKKDIVRYCLAKVLAERLKHEPSPPDHKVILDTINDFARRVKQEASRLT